MFLFVKLRYENNMIVVLMLKLKYCIRSSIGKKEERNNDQPYFI